MRGISWNIIENKLNKNMSEEIANGATQILNTIEQTSTVILIKIIYQGF